MPCCGKEVPSRGKSRLAKFSLPVLIVMPSADRLVCVPSLLGSAGSELALCAWSSCKTFLFTVPVSTMTGTDVEYGKRRNRKLGAHLIDDCRNDVLCNQIKFETDFSPAAAALARKMPGNPEYHVHLFLTRGIPVIFGFSGVEAKAKRGATCPCPAPIRVILSTVRWNLREALGTCFCLRYRRQENPYVFPLPIIV